MQSFEISSALASYLTLPQYEFLYSFRFDFCIFSGFRI